jgi:hypothetical protein
MWIEVDDNSEVQYGWRNGGAPGPVVYNYARPNPVGAAAAAASAQANRPWAGSQPQGGVVVVRPNVPGGIPSAPMPTYSAPPAYAPPPSYAAPPSYAPVPTYGQWPTYPPPAWPPRSPFESSPVASSLVQQLPTMLELVADGVASFLPLPALPPTAENGDGVSTDNLAKQADAVAKTMKLGEKVRFGGSLAASIARAFLAA